MSKSKTYERDLLYVVEPLVINPTKKIIGQLLVWGAFSLMLFLILLFFEICVLNKRNNTK